MKLFEPFRGTKEKQSQVDGLFQSVGFHASVEPDPPVSAAFSNYLNFMARTVKYLCTCFR